MRWSKVRKLVHDSFADSVRGRVNVTVTNADRRGTPWQDACNMGWISVDGSVVANMNPHQLRRLSISLPIVKDGTQEQKLFIVHPYGDEEIPDDAQSGTFMDFPQACWQYLHSSLKDSLESPDPFVSSLAVLNAKVGRTRLERARARELHPLTRAMLEFRLQAELEARSAAA
jgi:hypothetical protein